MVLVPQSNRGILFVHKAGYSMGVKLPAGHVSALYRWHCSTARPCTRPVLMKHQQDCSSSLFLPSRTPPCLCSSRQITVNIETLWETATSDSSAVVCSQHRFLMTQSRSAGGGDETALVLKPTSSCKSLSSLWALSNTKGLSSDGNKTSISRLSSHF